ncbi:MAG: YegP family protein [Oscillospiraceae bacterium]|nr:YegP family protein [Oscillospiraceae bacterium]
MGKFVMKVSDSGARFNLLAGNGQVIAVSQQYSDENACLTGIDSVRSSCTAPVEDQTVENFEVLANPKFEVYLDKAGEYRFRLKASNGQIVATGEGYKQMSGCLSGIESVRKNAVDAELVREKLPPIVKPSSQKFEGPIKKETK